MEVAVETALTEIPDDRLRLVFTCCHPAIAVEGRIALTLRLMCGLTTPEVARAFLVSEPTMAARITRAKKKIAAARIPYMVPAVDELPERLQAVLDVVHLVFTTGYTAPVGDELVRVDLVERAADLAHMLVELLPEEADRARTRPASCAAAGAGTLSRAGTRVAAVLAERASARTAEASRSSHSSGVPFRSAACRWRSDPAAMSSLMTGCANSGRRPGRPVLCARISSTVSGSTWTIR